MLAIKSTTRVTVFDAGRDGKEGSNGVRGERGEQGGRCASATCFFVLAEMGGHLRKSFGLSELWNSLGWWVWEGRGEGAGNPVGALTSESCRLCQRTRSLATKPVFAVSTQIFFVASSSIHVELTNWATSTHPPSPLKSLTWKIARATQTQALGAKTPNSRATSVVSRGSGRNSKFSKFPRPPPPKVPRGTQNPKGAPAYNAYACMPRPPALMQHASLVLQVYMYYVHRARCTMQGGSCSVRQVQYFATHLEQYYNSCTTCRQPSMPKAPVSFKSRRIK
jgi:hypothetical protein